MHLKQGTGKTLIGLTVAKLSNCVMIVVPASLVGNWMTEAKKWYPEMTLGWYKAGSKKSQDAAIASNNIIISYDMLKKFPMKNLKRFDTVILDECQHIKEITSGKSKAVREFVKKSGARLVMMSGTPMPNGVHEAYNLYSTIELTGEFDFKSWVGSYSNFRDTFQNTVGRKYITGGRALPVYEGFRNHQKYSDITSPVTFSVSVDLRLPEMLTSTVIVDAKVPASVDKDLEKLAIDNGRNPENFQTSRVLNAVAKAACWAEYILDSGEDAVVGVSAHPDAVKICAEKLRDAGWSVAVLNSDTSLTDRNRIVSEFQGGKYRALIGSLAVIKEGHNLQRSSLIVFNDVSTVPGDNEQAIARIHRMGQTRPCRCVFIARCGIDDRLTQLYLGKAKDLRSIESVNKGEEIC